MDPFIARKLAFMVDGDWELAPLRTYAPGFKFGKDWNITTAPLPSGGTPDYLASGWAWVIPNHAQHLTETLEVIKWLSSPSVNAEWCDLIGWLPASNKILKQASTMLVKADPGFAPFIQERDAHPNLTPEFAASPNAQAVQEEGISAEDKVTHLAASPTRALDEAQRRAQAGM
jgi:ABC-type glycerol-3-phosphate transport system substrate-binding protein